MHAPLLPAVCRASLVLQLQEKKLSSHLASYAGAPKVKVYSHRMRCRAVPRSTATKARYTGIGCVAHSIAVLMNLHTRFIILSADLGLIKRRWTVAIYVNIYVKNINKVQLSNSESNLVGPYSKYPSIIADVTQACSILTSLYKSLLRLYSRFDAASSAFRRVHCMISTRYYSGARTAVGRKSTD